MRKKKLFLMTAATAGAIGLLACSDNDASLDSVNPYSGNCTLNSDSTGISIICNDEEVGRLEGGFEGVYGASCNAESLKDDSGYKIICGGDSVGVVYNGLHGINGVNGENGIPGTPGVDGQDGLNGANGTSCTATPSTDFSGYEISCAGKVVGRLLNGTSCTVSKVDSKTTIACEDGTTANILDGEKGDTGASCSAEQNEDGDIEITCGTRTSTIAAAEIKGEDGASCTAERNEDDDVEITCGAKTITIAAADIKGEAGASCTAKKMSSGDIQFTCGKVTNTIELSEIKGPNGDGCKVAKLTGATSATITCGSGLDATTATISDGVAGASCSAEQNEDGDIVITCGTDTTTIDAADIKGEKGDDANCEIEQDTVSGDILITCINQITEETPKCIGQTGYSNEGDHVSKVCATYYSTYGTPKDTVYAYKPGTTTRLTSKDYFCNGGTTSAIISGYGICDGDELYEVRWPPINTPTTTTATWHKPADGASCTAEQKDDGNIEIICGSDTTTIAAENIKGEKGDRGYGCTSESFVGYAIITCQTGVDDDNEPQYKIDTIIAAGYTKFGNGDIVLASSVCGDAVLTEGQICVDGEPETPNCGNSFIDVDAQFCYLDKAYDLCGGNTYNPSLQFCGEKTDANSDDTIFVVTDLCGGVSYDLKTEFCGKKSGADSDDTIFVVTDLCGGVSYDLETEFCVDGVKYDKCGGETYDPSIQTCNSDSISCIDGETCEE